MRIKRKRQTKRSVGSILEATGCRKFIELLGCLNYFHGNETTPEGHNTTLKVQTFLSYIKVNVYEHKTFSQVFCPNPNNLPYLLIFIFNNFLLTAS